MDRLLVSRTATALLRLLTLRAGIPRNRILLIEAHSTDWRSLTFNGERHQLELRVTGPSSSEAARLVCDGLEDDELDLPGAIVADIAAERFEEELDGSTRIRIEALTVASD